MNLYEHAAGPARRQRAEDQHTQRACVITLDSRYNYTLGSSLLMLKHGVCYQQTVTSSEVQQQNTTWETIPPSHTPQGNTGTAHVSVELSQ